MGLKTNQNSPMGLKTSPITRPYDGSKENYIIPRDNGEALYICIVEEMDIKRKEDLLKARPKHIRENLKFCQRYYLPSRTHHDKMLSPMDMSKPALASSLCG